MEDLPYLLNVQAIVLGNEGDGFLHIRRAED